MYDPSDSICAISTPPGKGAIAVIRCSGTNAIQLTDKIIRLPEGKGKLSDQPPNTLHYSTVYEGNQIIDKVIIGLFKEPHSYTGEDTVEISCHGSPYIQKKILELLIKAGARMATAGEFTMRAFMNGKIDLTQVEAIADLISSGSKAAHMVAMNQMRGNFNREIKKLRDKLIEFTSLIELELDFSEEDVEFANRHQLNELLSEIREVLEHLSESFVQGNVIKNGIPVAIVGRTNSGKSTLLNLLVSEEKAIVSEIEGTTRDSIEDVISIRGVHFRLIDTAGIRHTEDVIEKLGIERTWQKIDQAMIVLQVLDINSTPDEILKLRKKLKKNNGDKHLIVLLNKIDLASKKQLESQIETLKTYLFPGEQLIPVSAKNAINLTLLEEALLNASGFDLANENDVIITNVRHFDAIEKALVAIKRASDALKTNIPGDLLSQDIRASLYFLGEITGEITNDEILGNIFKNFCIGK